MKEKSYFLHTQIAQCKFFGSEQQQKKRLKYLLLGLFSEVVLFFLFFIPLRS